MKEHPTDLMHYYPQLPKLLRKQSFHKSLKTSKNNPHQHGFKTNHSTYTALHNITNTISQGFNENQPSSRTIFVALDMSKAFDTVNIHTLINKIHNTDIPLTIQNSQLTTSKDEKPSPHTINSPPSSRQSKQEFTKEESCHQLSSTSTHQIFQLPHLMYN